jgi:hypothetical protein
VPSRNPRAMRQPLRTIGIAVMAALAAKVAAQPLDRLTGKVRTEQGLPLKEKDERTYLSAAISELNKAHNVMRGTY